MESVLYSLLNHLWVYCPQIMLIVTLIILAILALKEYNKNPVVLKKEFDELVERVDSLEKKIPPPDEYEDLVERYNSINLALGDYIKLDKKVDGLELKVDSLKDTLYEVTDAQTERIIDLWKEH